MPNQSDIDIDQLARRIVELGGNAGVTQRCVPLAAGGLDPDARVNYEFGLVLGVEEFRQEQFYHLQKDYFHNRGLHGYGVVSGLQVSPERTADNDVRVNVGTGVGIDQCGRTFTIRNDQCAYLRAWLERHRQSLNLTEGPLSLYVIGTYDECQDALVSIAGQPCASSEQSLAASRIRDSFNITLSATPPAMPAWAAIGRLAALMGIVRVIDGLAAEASEEAQIAARVRVLDDPEALEELGGPPEEVDGVPHPPYWLLPAEGLRETLDRLFMIWVTEVRPRLAPAVIDGCGASDPVETGVLLGRLDLTLSDAAAPIQFDFGEEAAPAASHDGRPYLLQTQAIQELLFLGGDDDEEQLAEVKVFAVPSIEIEENTVFIRLWFPYNGPIVLDETSLMIWDDSVDQEIDFRVEPSENRDVHVWRLELLFPRDSEPEDPLAWALERLRSARLLFNFHGHLTSVEIDEQVSMSLIDAMIQGGYSYVGYDETAQNVSVPYVPDLPPPATDGGLTERDVLRIIEANRQPIPKVIPLADLRFVESNRDNMAIFELWFHFDLSWELLNAKVEDGFRLIVLGEIIEDGPSLVEFGVEVERFEDRPNVFRAMVFSDGGPDRLRFLRFIFPTQEQFGIEGDWGGAGSLHEVMDQLGVRFENTYDNENFTGAPAVVLYGRVTDLREG